MSPGEHETYRSGVGPLQHLTKHRRPDICKPVRELSKTMDAPAPVHLKKMICAFHKRVWTKIRIDEEQKEVGPEGIE